MNSNGNKRAVVAASLTALVMGAVGGTAAFAGTTTKAKPKAPVTKTTVKTNGKKAVVAPAPAAHDEAAEHAAFATALAAKLGVSAESVTAALDSLRPTDGTRPDRGTFPKALADKLGLDEATVQTALDAVRPAHGPDGRDGHGPGSAAFASALATKLGVTAAQLKTAFDSIPRPAEGTRPDRAALAAALADKLGLASATVQTALDSLRPAGGPRGDGPHGHDAPPAPAFKAAKKK